MPATQQARFIDDQKPKFCGFCLDAQRLRPLPVPLQNRPAERELARTKLPQVQLLTRVRFQAQLPHRDPRGHKREYPSAELISGIHCQNGALSGIFMRNEADR